MRKVTVKSMTTRAGTAAMIIFVHMAAAGCGDRYCRLSEKSVDIAMKSRAMNMATAILESGRNGVSYALDQNATADMKKVYSPDRQKEVYKEIRKLFGDFSSLEYRETWINRDGSLHIFRLRGKFSGIEEQPEVRVVLNREGKFAGFWVKPWKDEL